MASEEQGDIVMLNNSQLRTLAKLLFKQEEPLMANLNTERERVKFIQQCNEAFDRVISILDKSSDLIDKLKNEGSQEKAELSLDLDDYMNRAVNATLQNFRDVSLRVNCIAKIESHFDKLCVELKSIDPENLTNIRKLAKEVSMSKKVMWEYASKSRSLLARKVSQAYSAWVKEEGMEFSDLIARKKLELGFKAEMAELAESDQLKVYHAIIMDSGRAEFPLIEWTSVGLGVAAFVTFAALMVTDIVTAAHPVEAALRGGLNALNVAGGFAVQLVVEAAVTEVLVDAGVGAMMVTPIGFVIGAVAGLLFTLAGGSLIDIILGSEGKKAPNLSEDTFYHMQMPDGMDLAVQIAYP